MFANTLKRTVLIIAVDDKMIKKVCDQILNKRVNNMIKLSEERDTKNLMTNLPLVFGAKYFITTNLATKYGWM